MTHQEIDSLIAKRDRIAMRYAYRTHQLDQIDRKLSQVPAGQDNRVDLALGRPCAVLPTRVEYGPQPAPSDYRIANRPDNPNWRGVAAWFDESVQDITAAQAEQYRLMSDGKPDGIVDHSDAQSGAWK